MKCLLLLSIIIVSSPILAADFWADRLGGGADEVFVQSLLTDDYTGLSNQDLVQPTLVDDELVFDIHADTEAIVAFSDEVLPTDIAADSANQIISLSPINDTAGNPDGYKIGKGNTRLRLKTKANAPETSLLDSDKGGSENYGVAVVDFSDSPYALSVFKSDRVTRYGKQTILTAHVTDNTDYDSNADVLKGNIKTVNDASVQAVVEYPDGSKKILRMKDSGNSSHGDTVKGDSVYSQKLTARQPGEYRLKIMFKASLDGTIVKRSEIIHVTVDDTRMRVISHNTNALIDEILGQPIEEGRLGLPIAVRVLSGDMPEVVRTRAEVWAKDSNGNDSVVGWIGGLVMPTKSNSGKNNWTVPFTFHTGWLKNDHLPPYTIRSIKISDLGTGDELIFNEDRQVQILGMQSIVQESGTALALRSDSADDKLHEMSKGVHPSEMRGKLNTIPLSTIRENNRLLLLQGFCTRNAPSRRPFDDVIQLKAWRDDGTIFNTNIDRLSADMRALDIARHFEFQRGTFRGVVAHSHGGMAAASLLNDFSYMFNDRGRSRPPNIVAMGTPFNGAQMANFSSNEIGKILNKISGAIPNCKVPYDLRKSTNPSWRNRIGWRTRYQITSWYTTHRKSYWYRLRLCGDASRLINGVDDGVIKPSEGLGFADGGEYHKSYSGHCHGFSNNANGDQWWHPEFRQFVNDLFHSEFEEWRPY